MLDCETTLEDFELQADIDYEVNQRKIQNQIMDQWSKLNEKLKNQNLPVQIKKDLEEFNKLLNYWL